MSILLQPCAQAVAKRHFDDTIATPVPLGRIEPFVDASTLAAIEAACGDEAMAWGLTPAIDGSSVPLWQKLEPGDVAAFFGGGRVFFAADIVLMTRNAPLANELWGTDGETGMTWELMYFLAGGVTLDLPTGDLTSALGYPTDRVLRARVAQDIPNARHLLKARVSADYRQAEIELRQLLNIKQAEALQRQLAKLDAAAARLDEPAKRRLVLQYERNPVIAKLVKQRDNYTC